MAKKPVCTEEKTPAQKTADKYCQPTTEGLKVVARSAGRPSVYRDEIADKILDMMMDGKSIRSICEEEGMPSRRTVLRWQERYPDFDAKCARARTLQADVIHDDLIDIEDGVLAGTIAPDAARAAISSKQWRSAKLAPKKYGDKMRTEISGPEGAPMRTISLPPEEYARIAAKVLREV